MTEDFRDAAHRIARRLDAQALWDGPTCTWRVRSTRKVDGGALVPAPAGLYQGTAGIGLFLAESAALAGSDALRATALAALARALQDARAATTYPVSFYSGLLGVAFAAYRAGTILDERPMVAEAAEAVVQVTRSELRPAAVDVIAGAAGAIPPLLWFASELNCDAARAQADRLGLQLLRSAYRLPEGWCWPTMQTAARGLAGFAHGAAGIGSAALELWSVTADPRYLYAAERAFAYERHHYDHEFRNWPDFRHQELGDLVFEGREDELRARLAAGEEFVWRRAPGMIAWCHGAAGIALSRARAYELTQRDEWRAECVAAASVTADMLRAVEAQNYSLCHGAGGNCVAVLRAARSLGDASLAQNAREALMLGIRRYEDAGQPWPAGTYMGLSDPSFMIGEAGTGFALLAASGLPLPYLLCFESSTPVGVTPPLPSTEHLLREEIGTRLGAALRTLGADDRRPAVFPAVLTGVRSVLEAAERIADARGTSLAALDDATATPDIVELWAIRLLSRDLDTLKEFTEAFMRVEPDAVDWDAAAWRLAAHVCVVRCASPSADDGPTEGGARDTPVLLVRQRDGVIRRDLSPLAGVVVSALRTPRGLEDVVDVLQDQVEAPRAVLATRVRAQVAALYRAGLVTAQRVEPAARVGAHAAHVA